MKKATMILALMAAMPLATFAEDDKDTTVVIPATGHLAIKPSRNLTGPATVTVSSFYGSSSATSPGLRFNNQVLGDDVVIAHAANSSTGLILTAQPGTYTLTLTDRTATKQFFSTSAYWVSTPEKVYRKDCRIYKFVNTPEKVGFERDEKYAADDYQYCDMAEGEHLYMPLSTKPLERIVATLNTTLEQLAFIPWSEIWDCPMVNTSSIQTVDNGQSAASSVIYDLQGRRISPQPSALSPLKGIYITNGKKYIAR